MLTTDELSADDTTLSCPIPYSIACGIRTIKHATITNLTPLGFQYHSTTRLRLVLDAPVGFALHTLETEHYSLHTNIVMTWNPCIEYWEDLWDLQPMILVANDVLDIPTALSIDTVGIQQRFTPCKTSILTKYERRILRLLSQGRSNQQIADDLTIRCQSVRNSLTSIYQKLDLSDRSEAILYYWGIWTSYMHVLDE